MTNQHSSPTSPNNSSNLESTENIARMILTAEQPALYVGSSHRWGWNDPDPRRKSLLARFREAVPGMELVHVPDLKAPDTMDFSSGLSVFAGIPPSRMEKIMTYLRGLEPKSGKTLLMQDPGNAFPADYSLDISDPSQLENLVLALESLLRGGTLVPWRNTPAGIAFTHALEKKKEEDLRKSWTWDETKEMNIPEEFRHELATGLDENAE